MTRRFKIDARWVGEGAPTYFIADIAANHDGNLDKAVELIHVAARAGADAAKFQHFKAAEIVSQAGFDAMEQQLSHQGKWKKSVYQVYQEASVPWDWTDTLKRECDSAGITFFSSPYDFGAVDMLDPHVSAFKIGSGDITWPEMLTHIASKGKPVLLATGASDLGEVQRAVDTILAGNQSLLLMQCNTNYTASLENFKYLQLNVLKTFAAMYPGLPLGLSDHTPGHSAVLGAVALGACAVEKHFTLDRSDEGPDHPFSMEPADWREMVDRTRELELALGDGNKRVQENEQATVIVQRRCLRACGELSAGHVLTRADVAPLRPAPIDAIYPYDLPRVIGRRLRQDVGDGAYLKWTDLD